MRRKLNDEIIIKTVSNYPNQTQTQLADLLDCSQSTVSNYIRKLVDAGKIRQEVNTDGVYYYTLPEYKFKVEAPVKIVDGYEKFMSDLKSEFRASLDKRVRDYLNEQYKKIMHNLVQDLHI